MEFAGIILIGIGVNTFMQGLWLLLFNTQLKRIENIEKTINQLSKKEY